MEIGTGLFKQSSDNEGFDKRLIEREYYAVVPRAGLRPDLALRRRLEVR